MTNEQVREVALANGFKLKLQDDGSYDLNPYVYDFAEALIAKHYQLRLEEQKKESHAEYHKRNKWNSVSQGNWR